MFGKDRRRSGPDMLSPNLTVRDPYRSWVKRAERGRGDSVCSYSGLIATLRNLITPSPCWSVNGPSLKRSLRRSTVF